VNLSSKLVRDLIMVLITGHVLFAFFIVINPVTQDFERVLRIPIGKSYYCNILPMIYCIDGYLLKHFANFV